MAFEQKEGTLTVFRDTRNTNPKAPTHTGTAKYKGEDLDIALWVKEDKNGKKYFSGTIRPKRVTEPTPDEEPFV